MQGSSPRVLVVEDDESLGAGLVALLAANGHEVRWARTAQEARAQLEEATPDLILLDLVLPEAGEPKPQPGGPEPDAEGGLDLCAEIRERNADVVIVVVTARTDEADAVRALDGGADDLVLKPYRPVELLARLRAHLRRRGDAGPDELRAGPIRLDQRSRRAWVGDAEIALRPKEHELLAVVVASAGEAVRREQFMDEVWDEHWSGATKTL